MLKTIIILQCFTLGGVGAVWRCCGVYGCYGCSVVLCKDAVVVMTFYLIKMFCCHVSQYLPPLQATLGELREFWDPDTVELMEWIRYKFKPIMIIYICASMRLLMSTGLLLVNNETIYSVLCLVFSNSTAPAASFAGSMQLLAGVKLCTGRHITNHPHYENKWLRKRTLQVELIFRLRNTFFILLCVKVGQIYGRRKPKDVHEILKSIDANYIILEDSICLAQPRMAEKACRFPDLIDLSNGHQLDESLGKLYDKDLKSTNVPRFCDEIRYGRQQYSRLFKKVMENHTFRVYKVI